MIAKESDIVTPWNKKNLVGAFLAPRTSQEQGSIQSFKEMWEPVKNRHRQERVKHQNADTLEIGIEHDRYHKLTPIIEIY